MALGPLQTETLSGSLTTVAAFALVCYSSLAWGYYSHC